MSTTRALLILLIVVVFVSAFIAFCSLIGVSQYWAGFLFLLQWSLMEDMENERLLKSTLGALVGTSIAFLPIWLTPGLGFNGAMMIMVAVILVAVFLQIRNIAPVAVNGATMLFLTVNTIPYVAQNAPPVSVFAGLAAGIVFFGGFALIGARVAARRRSAAAAPVASTL